MYNATHYSTPFDHWVVEDFFDADVANQIASDFYDYEDERWLTRHQNALENKRISTHWDWYPKSIYSAFFYLCSAEFISKLEALTGIKGLIADYGLHGGGMHIHGAGDGKLNLHQDAELHPKLGLLRKLNIVIYLNPNWLPKWGGELELWDASTSSTKPDTKISAIAPLFNRAVIFDTTQNSWHGIPNAINSPAGEHRKSIALFYYVKNDSLSSDYRTRAMFAPSKDQENDPLVLQAIKDRLATAAAWGITS